MWNLIWPMQLIWELHCISSMATSIDAKVKFTKHIQFFFSFINKYELHCNLIVCCWRFSFFLFFQLEEIKSKKQTIVMLQKVQLRKHEKQSMSKVRDFCTFSFCHRFFFFFFVAVSSKSNDNFFAIVWLFFFSLSWLNRWTVLRGQLRAICSSFQIRWEVAGCFYDSHLFFFCCSNSQVKIHESTRREWNTMTTTLCLDGHLLSLIRIVEARFWCSSDGNF